ncbi:MAG: hypothetical protein ACK4M3_01325 [Pyrobaculum sp.]
MTRWITQQIFDALRDKLEELEDGTELAAAIKSQPEGEEAAYIYRSYLVSALREGGLVALAFLDLDDVRNLDIPYVEDLEDIIVFHQSGLYPFVYPIAQAPQGIYLALGFKTVVKEVTLTGGLIDYLLENFGNKREELYREVLDKLQAFYGST